MKKNMNENFALLTDRVIDSLERSDLEQINFLLKNIKKPTLITGVGGSSVVSNFLSKVLESKNGIIASNKEPRDLLYMNLKGYQNVVNCSYSGNNYGVDVSFNNDLNKYLFSANKLEDVNNITYICEKEKSFISLSSTLIPLAIALNYYLDGNASIIYEILEEDIKDNIEPNSVFEVMSGLETSTASKYLESTLIESGIAIPIIHDKYSYCHGRSTTSYKNTHAMIYFNGNKELDKLMLENLDFYYQEVIKLDYKYEDAIINDFYLIYRSMLLTKSIASLVHKDLSNVNYSPVVKKLYKYKGEM